MTFAPVWRPLGAARFYATEPESKAAQGEAAAAEGNGNGAEAEAEDPLKKELEAKNKEIIDLKVCRVRHSHCQHEELTGLLGSISALSSRI